MRRDSFPASSASVDADAALLRRRSRRRRPDFPLFPVRSAGPPPARSRRRRRFRRRGPPGEDRPLPRPLDSPDIAGSERQRTARDDPPILRGISSAYASAASARARISPPRNRFLPLLLLLLLLLLLPLLLLLLLPRDRSRGSDATESPRTLKLCVLEITSSKNILNFEI